MMITYLSTLRLNECPSPLLRLHRSLWRAAFVEDPAGGEDVRRGSTEKAHRRGRLAQSA